MEAIVFAICFVASVIGAICGIGGGVIIKPVLDAWGIMDVETISFLSGCTVLAMTTYSVGKSKASRHSQIDYRTTFPLAIGAALGGVVGKTVFNIIKSVNESNQNKVGMFQSIVLLLLTIGTLLYTIKKDNIKTYLIKKKDACLGIGVALGFCSSFLGIGGGPFNLVVLNFFFSMPIKTAAENSLYIIFFSQITSLLLSLVRGKIPNFPWIWLVLMSIGGITGGIVGRKLNKKIDDKMVNNLFILIITIIILICIYDVYKYSA